MRERRRGEARERSPWTRAGKLGPRAPRTLIEPALRALCLQGEKALSLRTDREPPGAHFGAPLDAEAWLAWRTDGISIYLYGPVPGSVLLRLGPAADVVAEPDWSSDPATGEA